MRKAIQKKAKFDIMDLNTIKVLSLLQLVLLYWVLQVEASG
jgi:hypothetical protein